MMLVQMTEQLKDGGPIYRETFSSGSIVEPWNAFSSLLFLLPVIYFLWTLKGHYRENAFVVYFCSPLLSLGGIGSALFHGLRNSPLFLFMDFVPIAVLTLGLSIYFMNKILPHWLYILGIILLSIFIRWFASRGATHQNTINISYFITGLLIFIPGFVYTWKTRFKQIRWLLTSGVCLSLALFFRYYDERSPLFLSQGTHWLWHLFCAAGALFLGFYLIKMKMTEEWQHQMK